MNVYIEYLRFIFSIIIVLFHAIFLGGESFRGGI